MMHIKHPAPMTFWANPDWPFIEGRRSCSSQACYQPHSHPSWSVGIVDGGRSQFTHHSQTVTLHTGAVVLVAPDAVHACNPEPGTHWSYRMFHIDAHWLDALACRSDMQSLPRTHGVLYDCALVAQLEQLTALVSGQTQLPAHQHMAALEACLLAIFRLASDPKPLPPQPQDCRITKALHYLAHHPQQRVTLVQLAKAAGTSPWHLVRLFRRELGITPHAWLMDQQINRARRLVRTRQPLADIATQLGFADQAHLQRVFKRHVAATPGQYRQVQIAGQGTSDINQE